MFCYSEYILIFREIYFILLAYHTVNFVF